MIRYMGTRKDSGGASVYVFIVNGLEKEVRESNLKQHPGCFDALPAAVASLAGVDAPAVSTKREEHSCRR